MGGWVGGGRFERWRLELCTYGVEGDGGELIGTQRVAGIMRGGRTLFPTGKIFSHDTFTVVLSTTHTPLCS